MSAEIVDLAAWKVAREKSGRAIADDLLVTAVLNDMLVDRAVGVSAYTFEKGRDPLDPNA